MAPSRSPMRADWLSVVAMNMVPVRWAAQRPLNSLTSSPKEMGAGSGLTAGPTRYRAAPSRSTASLTLARNRSMARARLPISSERRTSPMVAARLPRLMPSEIWVSRRMGRGGARAREHVGRDEDEEHGDAEEDEGVGVRLGERLVRLVVILLGHEGPAVLGLLREGDHALARGVGVHQLLPLITAEGDHGGIRLEALAGRGMRNDLAPVVHEEHEARLADLGIGDRGGDVADARANREHAQHLVEPPDGHGEDDCRLTRRAADDDLLPHLPPLDGLLEVAAIAVEARRLLVVAAHVVAVGGDGEGEVDPL